MKRNLLLGALMVFLPLLLSAQETKVKGNKMKTKPSWWGTHHITGEKYVYFPDYYTYYEPDRGYVYWNETKWTTSETVPSYMSSVDLNSARVQVIEETTTRPEVKYKYYMKTYPAQKVEVTVPVPR
jgi:hypothetical protein